eukprot:scaffold76513_cov38-Cyclotella_meneghiniana.AAC.1
MSNGSRPLNVTPVCPRLTVTGVYLFIDRRLPTATRLSPVPTITFVALQGGHDKSLNHLAF